MMPEEYFKSCESVNRKRYGSLHAFFVNDLSAREAADTSGYRLSFFYSLIRDFRQYLKEGHREDFFLKEPVLCRKPDRDDDLNGLIIRFLKKNFSAEDIAGTVNSKSYEVSCGYVFRIPDEAGFARLPGRSEDAKKHLGLPPLKAPVTEKLTWETAKFHSSHTGLLAFLPVIFRYGIHCLIERSSCPSTRTAGRLSAILCFPALKLSGIRRYSQDDLRCTDRGPGLFAGLNTLPKTARFCSCSSRVDSAMNLSFLKELHRERLKHGLLPDTSNPDFTDIPCWDESEHPENNRSGKRGKALPCMPAVPAQDPQGGITDYGDCKVLHGNESAVVLEYPDFYRIAPEGHIPLKYPVFDGKFTGYENPARLDDRQIRFITVRRRGGKMPEQTQQIDVWKTVRVEASGLKKRALKVHEQTVALPGYRDAKTGKPKTIRQVITTGHGKIKPAVMLTSDFNLTIAAFVRKYSRSRLVEKDISQQTDFFHLGRVSSSTVIKVDFDLSMSILAHNLYRLPALSLDRYRHLTDERIYEKFTVNNGEIEIEPTEIRIDLKKKRKLPLLIDFFKVKYPWLNDKNVNFNPTASS